MGVRKESVELSLIDAGFTTKMAKATAETALLNGELRELDGQSVRVNRSTTALGSQNGGIRKVGDESRRASSDLNQFTGRLNLLATAGATLGPSLAPVAAVGVPALTSLAGALGATVGAVGVAVLAFHGLGDAVKALDAYQLEPTDANLRKLHDTLGQMSPAAQGLVKHLDDLEPVLRKLQRTAQNEMFPGINQGLDESLRLLPEAQTVITRLSREVGNLIADGGAALSGDKDWEAFFQFIETDAVPTLDKFARATGNVIAGFGSLLVAFRPLSDDFSTGLLDMSRDFRTWAASLSESDGFHAFVDYIRENGPAVGRFFVTTATALTALVKAAAPWGSAVLPVLTEAAQAFAAVADSPIGPVIYDAAAAMLVFNRAGALFGSEGVAKVIGGFSTLGTTLKTLPGDLRAASTSLGTFSAAQRDFNVAGSAAASAQVFAQESLRESTERLGKVAKQAAGVGGVMALVDGMGRAKGAASTLETSLGAAAAGFSVGGPWGAAVGGAIGLVLSLGKSHKTASTEIADLTDTFDKQTGAITENTRSMVAQDLQTKGFLDSADKLGISASLVTDAVLGSADAQKQLNTALAAYSEDTANIGYEQADGFTAQQKATVDAARAAVGLRDALPGLITHFGGQAADAKQLARALSGDYATGANIATKSTQELNKEQAALQEEQAGLRKAARDEAKQWTDFGKSLDDTKVSLSQWIADMQKQADALANFTANAKTAADKGLKQGLIKQLEAAGPAGALRMKQLANASTTEIAKANKAFADGQAAIRAYTRMKVPPIEIKVVTKFDRRLTALTSGSLQLQGGRDGDPSTPYAAGGYTGRGGKYQPAGVVHRGEVVLPQEVVRSDAGFLRSRYGFLPGMSQLPGYAAGGYVPGVGRSIPVPTFAAGSGAAGSGTDLRAEFQDLKAAILSSRPLYGDVHINGDPTAFKREMQQDRQRQGIGGL